MPIPLNAVIAIILAYLIGAVSSSILIARWLKLPDPRSLGSGNPGATNMLRTGSKKAAALTLAGDLLKGLLPLLVAHSMQFDLHALCLVGLAAIVGHMFPVYYSFRGGKGVATTLGVLLGIHWPLALLWTIIWVSVAKLTKLSSLAALCAMIALPIISYLMSLPQAIVLLTLGISILVIWRHQPNIKNLLQGKEGHIGSKK